VVDCLEGADVVAATSNFVAGPTDPGLLFLPAADTTAPSDIHRNLSGSRTESAGGFGWFPERAKLSTTKSQNLYATTILLTSGAAEAESGVARIFGEFALTSLTYGTNPNIVNLGIDLSMNRSSSSGWDAGSDSFSVRNNPKLLDFSMTAPKGSQWYPGYDFGSQRKELPILAAISPAIGDVQFSVSKGPGEIRLGVAEEEAHRQLWLFLFILVGFALYSQRHSGT
jgi:hypothetical protein